MDKIEYVYTFGMDAETIDRRLEENEVGVLALADDSSAYAVPVGYHYDGASLYVRLATDGSSTKMAYVETTTDACFCLYSNGSSDESWSILVHGPLRKLTGSKRERFDAATLNESFHRLYVFDQDVEALEPEIWELEMESVTGRKRGE
ncbi:pyridoxamine 5'-phosphate oxidase family protein [Salinadaptatus halalkaliphilus]|uniref:Pyridoxamine 5'-phosphate oxidase family protein n=1 Tax=Salinadaptatus halalkaliphilus TaxID=2419781 RepID=A0A4S3TJZ0_9EURY|nr:pyridoxamine 5'-phosphate oxidase family protein [Salinadaptatus halalkaliphilus]THE64316.1 pyridoxamine 5'-phosphate oxidase family protein [Salinadaptatus halalkaliphilus]